MFECPRCGEELHLSGNLSWITDRLPEPSLMKYQKWVQVKGESGTIYPFAYLKYTRTKIAWIQFDGYKDRSKRITEPIVGWRLSETFPNTLFFKLGHRRIFAQNFLIKSLEATLGTKKANGITVANDFLHSYLPSDEVLSLNLSIDILSTKDLEFDQ